MSASHRLEAKARLTTYCWCGRTAVSIPAHLVRRGQTVACHRRDCHEGTPTEFPADKTR